MHGIVRTARPFGAWLPVLLLAAMMALALGVAGCGDTEDVESATMTTSAVGVTTTAYGRAESDMSTASASSPTAAAAPADSAKNGSARDDAALAALTTSAGQKVISDAQLDIEVEPDRFEGVFGQALSLADRYGGYLVGSSSQAAGDEAAMKSGTISIRVPATSFTRALADAAKLGKVRSRQVQTQDVTEEYVDLKARIANSKAHVQALLDLLTKAKTVDEILQVQQVLTGAQQQLEELEGRMRYLDEHTGYSTITLTIYETGATVIAPSSGWGFTQALKDALHNVVRAVNAIMRGLGILIPVLIVLAIIAYIIHRIWRFAVRRRQEHETRRHHPYVEGGHPPAGRSGPTDRAESAPPVATAATEAPTVDDPSPDKTGTGT
ncbi:MAG: DUF4349 domain-containing protein [Thermoleophilia bacterium]|jgi:hypothetical protein